MDKFSKIMSLICMIANLVLVVLALTNVMEMETAYLMAIWFIGMGIVFKLDNIDKN